MDDDFRETFRARLGARNISSEAIEKSLQLSERIAADSRPDHDLGVRLTQVIVPFLEGGEDLEDMQMLCAMATNAWNTTLMPLEEEDGFIAFSIEAMTDGGDTDGFLAGFTKALCSVKRALYPEDMRFIGDCDVKQAGNQFEILASAGPEFMNGPTPRNRN